MNNAESSVRARGTVLFSKSTGNFNPENERFENGDIIDLAQSLGNQYWRILKKKKTIYKKFEGIINN